MALLTLEEQKRLQEKGLYVKEKCDNCHKPLLEPLRYTGKGSSKKETWCCVCATGAGMGGVLNSAGNVSQMEEKRMAPKEKKEPKEKVLGVFRVGTPMGDLATALVDEKPHKLASILPGIRKTYKLADGWKGTGPLKSIGEKKGLYAVIFDKEKGTIQIKLGKPAKKSAEVKPEEPEEKPAKKAKKKESPAEEEEPVEKGAKDSSKDGTPVSSKQQGAVERTVRQTLKSGKEEWTRNKLVEHLKTAHEIDPKRTRMAIEEELKKGGLAEEDGVLSLV